jgi:Kdo2-lipid IVA lauroyltransferase/acyltransferase
MTLYSGLSLFFINLFTRLIPRRFFPLFAALTGWLVYLFVPMQRRGMRDNLRTVTGRTSVEMLVLSAFYKYSRNWADVMLMIRLRGDKLFSLMGTRSSSHPLDDALAAGTGAILVSPHLGNWELGGLGLAEMGYVQNIMTFREPDETVNDLREKFRKERGIGIIYVDRNDSSPLAIIEAVNALRRNEIVVLLGERDGSSHTLRLDFFGRPTDIPVGAAYLAMASGAPVIPVFVPLEGDLYATYMEESIYFRGNHGDHGTAIREGTEKLLRVFEQYIRRYPDQWYNFFPYWRN